MFCTFLRCGDAGDRRERDKHGIDKPWSEWKQYEWDEGEELGYVVSDSWKYVARVVGALVRDETPGKNRLEMILGAT